MSTKEAMDLGGSRRRGSGPKAGSVWESRMKIDEVKGGIKVFNGTHENSEGINKNNCGSSGIGNDIVSNSADEVIDVDKKVNNMRPKQSPVGGSGKRKTWKSESCEGSPIQIARQRSEMSKNLDEQSKELSVSADAIKKSPVQIKKTRSGSVQLRKMKLDFSVEMNDSKSEGSSELRKVKSDPSKNLDETLDGNLQTSLPLQFVKAKTKNSDDKKLADESTKDLEKLIIGGIDKNPGEIKKSRSEEDCKEFGVCEKTEITSNVANLRQIKTPSDGEEEDEECDKKEEEEEIDKEIEVEIEKKNLEIKEINLRENKPKKFLTEEKKLLHNNERSVPISPIVKKQPPPVINHARIHPNPSKHKPIPVSDKFHGIPRTQSKLQKFVDVIMWRDVSKSAFIFGIGTFVIISSSYTKDFNISFISVLSYFGLVYLAAIFLFRSLITRFQINRGAIDMNNTIDQDCVVVGEEEAIWLIKLVLPIINEFLLKLRALFSGDPATTMKLAVLLFILARCGSSITIWKMAKLGFFGVFTVPKVCSSYSLQLTAYGTFWIRRFRDAWESCSHKKAVGFAIFTLVWNLSSVVARIWAVFMLFVAFKYYQHSMIREEWREEEKEEEAKIEVSSWKQRQRPALSEIRKLKKVC